MVKVLEQGNIAFAYRQKVDVDVVRDFDDVQRLFMVLQPEQSKYRLVVIGRKKLPEPGPYQRFWGVVESVSEDAQSIKNQFAASTYETKTRGTRHQKEARFIAAGAYAIYLHDDHSHLNFNVDKFRRKRRDEDEERKVEFQFHIPDYGEYIVTAKNYEYQDVFGGYRFQPIRSTEILDYPDSQIVIIATDHGIQSLSSFPPQPWPLAL
jgi:hypothetical protein